MATLVSTVYHAVKNDICMGRVEPGEKLLLAEIGKAHGVSLSVVREAVTRLASEGLVEARPQQGFTVRALSVPDLRDLTRVRIEIETMTLRESIETGDVAWEAEVVAAHHRLDGAVRPPDAPADEPNYAWMKAHSEFHAALASASTSPLLKALRQQLFEAGELYRFWSVSLTKTKRQRNIRKEHRALMNAAIGHDADTAVRLISEHIQRTTDLLLAGREE